MRTELCYNEGTYMTTIMRLCEPTRCGHPQASLRQDSYRTRTQKGNQNCSHYAHGSHEPASTSGAPCRQRSLTATSAPAAATQGHARPHRRTCPRPLFHATKKKRSYSHKTKPPARPAGSHTPRNQRSSYHSPLRPPLPSLQDSLYTAQSDCSGSLGLVIAWLITACIWRGPRQPP